MNDTLVIRTPCGLSGDMFVCGLARLLDLDDAAVRERASRIGVAALNDALRIEARVVAGITGWHACVTLPHEHAHRGLQEILSIIERSSLAPGAQALAGDAFHRLARVEAEMHGIPKDQVHFHEIGALDSILDVCLTAELLVESGVTAVYCSPLPVSDGVVRCQHGLLATPAPAVFRMLEGVPVYGVSNAGETVTPTALALLLAMDTHFGPWPALTVRRTARAYGTRVFAELPNGALFAIGQRAPKPAPAPHESAHADHSHAHPHD